MLEGLSEDMEKIGKGYIIGGNLNDKSISYLMHRSILN